MASFLDNAGLIKFWELIKQYLQDNFSSKTTTDRIERTLNSLPSDLIKSPLNFSEELKDGNTIVFMGKENPRLSTLSKMGTILINLYFNKLFYLFDTTSQNKSSFSIQDILDNLNISLTSPTYLGRVYNKNSSDIQGNLDIYIYRKSYTSIGRIELYNISIIPVEEGNLLFSDGLFQLENLNNFTEDSVRIQDPLIPGLTLKKLKSNLDDYLPYLENKSTEIKFKVEYANAIRGLLKIYKKPSGSNELELIGIDSTEDTNNSKHLTPGEVVTTYLEPGDRLYMYGSLLNINDKDTPIVQNIFKLLPILPNTNPNTNYNKYLINITPCNIEGTLIDNINLDQHYLEYGGNIRGILGYTVNNSSIIIKDYFDVYGVGFTRFISACKYIREIKFNTLMNQPNDIYNQIIGIKDSNIILNIPIYKDAFSKTSIKKGYISLMLYSEDNGIGETVRMFTNFNKTYFSCHNLTELDVLIDWYSNSKIPDNILTNMIIDNNKYTDNNGYYLLKSLSGHIVNNIKGCKNIRKITLKYKGDKYYHDKIKDLLNEIKDHILSNKDIYSIYDKDINDYTIEIEAI